VSTLPRSTVRGAADAEGARVIAVRGRSRGFPDVDRHVELAGPAGGPGRGP
jgi:hypothetical protein